MSARLRKRVTCTVQLSLCLPPLRVEMLPTRLLLAVQAVFISQNTLCVRANLRKQVPCTVQHIIRCVYYIRCVHLTLVWRNLSFLMLVAVQAVLM